MIEHVIVMAASPEHSMGPLTRTRPKAMLPILGKPMIAHVMDSFYRAGMRRFTVVVGEDEGSVALWLSSKWHPDANISYAYRGHQRGTAAALYAARSQIDGPFLITSCDALIPEEHIRQLRSYFDDHLEDSGVLSLHAAPNEIAEVGGVLRDPHDYVVFVSEKPSGGHQGYMTALPVYGFTPEVVPQLDKLPTAVESGGRALASFIQLLIDDGFLIGTVQGSERIRLSTPDDLLLANRHILDTLPMAALLSDVPTSVEIIEPVYIDPGVRVGAGARLGPHVYLETGSVIGERATLRDTVVLGVRVGREQTVDGEVIHMERL